MIAETVIKRMNETLATKRRQESSLSKWQRKWRVSCRRIIAMMRVDAYKAMLQKMGYTGQFLGDERPTTVEVMHAPIDRPVGEDSLEQLSAKVLSQNDSSMPSDSNCFDSPKRKSSRSILGEVGKTLVSSASSPAAAS